MRLDLNYTGQRDSTFQGSNVRFVAMIIGTFKTLKLDRIGVSQYNNIIWCQERVLGLWHN